ncbi:MAG: hypothetical protein HQK83_12070 [Fibrobacteria bacterium]|nr:hypothetical protein [Fibrobacteria bacterium]
MTILIDSAIISEVKNCFASYPWVQGLSTNPKLLKMASEKVSPKSVIETLASLTSGPFYYQVHSKTETELLKECRLAQKIVGKNLRIKIMPSEQNYAFTYKYRSEFNFCFTAVLNLTQAKLAYEAGAGHIAVYVNRMLRNELDPFELIGSVK